MKIIEIQRDNRTGEDVEIPWTLKEGDAEPLDVIHTVAGIFQHQKWREEGDMPEVLKGRFTSIAIYIEL
jgi:hypothetical protein